MGKDNSVPAPDPRLIDAQISGVNTQNDLINMIISNSRDLQPLQRQQMQQAIDANNLAMQQSQQDRDWILNRRGALTGLQNDLIDKANTFDTESERQRLAAQAMGDVNQAFDSTRQQGLRTMTRMGINPNDGRMMAFNQQSNDNEALALATAANKTREAARQEGYNMKTNAANLLAGYPSMGMQATGAMAGYGLQGLNAANTGLSGLNSGYSQALSGAYGMTNSATNAYGAQASAYNNSQTDPLGSILGGLGGLASGMAAWKSDRLAKRDIEPVGKDPRTGLSLYEFSYKADPDRRRFVGVMADEVADVDLGAIRFVDGEIYVDYARLGIEFKEVCHAAR